MDVSGFALRYQPYPKWEKVRVPTSALFSLGDFSLESSVVGRAFGQLSRVIDLKRAGFGLL